MFITLLNKDVFKNRFLKLIAVVLKILRSRQVSLNDICRVFLSPAALHVDNLPVIYGSNCFICSSFYSAYYGCK